MGTDRDRFLSAVRQAVIAGNRASAALPVPERAGVGYQGAGADPVGRFAAELAAAGGVCRIVRDRATAVSAILQTVCAKSSRRVLVGTGPVIDALELPSRLRETGLEVSDADTGPEKRFAADVGISGVDYLVAETGSLVLLTGPGRPRSLSLLPPIHIAVADRSQILPDLFDLFDGHIGRVNLPASLSLITGPSKTGDIELRLVTGVHGPGELHVVLIDSGSGA